MTCFTSNLESQGLSTTRISRLLRPLRTKCIALATAHPTVCDHTASTYGSKARSAEFHPLDILPPPDSIRSYHIDHRSVASLRAAIYGVRDCFREIVLKTKTAEACESTHRVTRLADLCSIIVGEHMEADDFGTEAEEDSEHLCEMEYLYGLIPVQYRRSALLAHALDIVLRCPHHLTLLSILLDVSLQHDLYHESCVLLHRLLQASVSPVSRSGVGLVLRLCHSAHSNYLVDLAGKWKGAGRPTGAFVRILTETLVKAARPDLWRCKAVGKFARELHNHDFHSFMNMAGMLASSIGDIQTAEPYECGPFRAEESSLADQLNRWLNYSSPFCHAHSRNSASILQFLEQCRQSRLHQNPDSLAATLVCWATHYLSVAPSVDTHAAMSRLLKDISPTVKMYTLLVEQSFGATRTSMGGLQSSRASLQAYASCLRAEHLLLLEASLWACILRFVEASMDFLGRCGTEKAVSLYRDELIDLVADAEHRCFGRGLRAANSDPCPKATKSAWRWEEIPGCWIQCRDFPPAKKAKHHHKLKESCTRGLSNPVSALHLHEDIHKAVDYRGTPSSSFKSIVSSALSNRTKLHGCSQQKLTPRPPSCINGSRPTLLRPSHKSYPLEIVSASDDALDLFAYEES
ncbi:hypothetical protein FB451DRAFT_1210172 [Mycena latifolia]|nr:hypothetical protein FB451DRAFT_1210172 [Mycena latifolia]